MGSQHCGRGTDTVGGLSGRPGEQGARAAEMGLVLLQDGAGFDQQCQQERCARSWDPHAAGPVCSQQSPDCPFQMMTLS